MEAIYLVCVATRFLIVDDDRDLAENLAEIAQVQGYEASVASCAEEAMAEAQRIAYAGVFTDNRLPGCDGVELIKRLREVHYRGPVALTSALLDSVAVARAEELGAVDVLTKPIELRRFIGLLEEFAQPRYDVMIVDGNAPLAENLAEALQRAALRTLVGTSAAAALAFRKLPRFALIDLHLPDDSGVALAARLYARDPAVRLAFLSAYERPFTELASAFGNASKARCWLKPFDVAEVVEYVCSEVRKVAV